MRHAGFALAVLIVLLGAVGAQRRGGASLRTYARQWDHL